MVKFLGELVSSELPGYLYIRCFFFWQAPALLSRDLILLKLNWLISGNDFFV